MLHREITTDASGLKPEISKVYKFKNDPAQFWLEMIIPSAAGTSKSTKIVHMANASLLYFLQMKWFNAFNEHSQGPGLADKKNQTSFWQRVSNGKTSKMSKIQKKCKN